MSVSVTVISDTHLRHRELFLAKGDLLIHCGDMFTLAQRSNSVVTEVDAWFGAQPFDQILCVGGNHDFALQAALRVTGQPFTNAYYLQDETYRYANLNIYGSPWVPDLPTHAFSLSGESLKQAWQTIPSQTDILVTHTPPAGILDRSSQGRSYGCPLLAKQLERVRPRVHCFGHVHASAGCVAHAGTKFINASSIESRTGRMLRPITFTLS